MTFELWCLVCSEKYLIAIKLTLSLTDVQLILGKMHTMLVLTACSHKEYLFRADVMLINTASIAAEDYCNDANDQCKCLPQGGLALSKVHFPLYSRAGIRIQCQ